MSESRERRALPSVPLEPLLDRDPRELGVFRLLGRLGAGGMGVAYLADGLGQWAVVKVVRSELADDPAFRARLSRELDAIARLDGQSARVLEASLDGPVPWFAMEFIPGQTLDHRVKDRGPFTGDDLTSLAGGLANVIAGVHAAGIVHRDIKPANIMLSPDGPRLIDFGIAETDEGTQLTRTGSVMGSLGWLAPEQVRGDPTSAATDVHAWALCVVFAASGEPPFGSDTSAAALYRVLESTPQVPSSVREPLRGLLERALTKDAAHRPTLAAVTSGLSPRPAAPVAEQLTAPESASVPMKPASPRPADTPPPTSPSAQRPAPVPTAPTPVIRSTPTPPMSPAPRRRRGWIIGGAVAGAAVLICGIVIAMVSSGAKSCDGSSIPCAIGDIGPGGGVVFYDAGSQQPWGRYLEAAPQGWSGTPEDPEKVWCNTMTDPSTEVFIGTGRANTDLIVEACGKYSAAGAAVSYAGGGLGDWFLPSRDELDALYEQRSVVGGLAAGNFWSSSQSGGNASSAWLQWFGDGGQYDSSKNLVSRVRPVRAF